MSAILFNDIVIKKDTVINGYRIILFYCNSVYFIGFGKEFDNLHTIKINAINLLYRVSYFNSAFTSDIVAINRFNEIVFILKKLGGLGGLIK